jgi:hypothetical protein
MYLRVCDSLISMTLKYINLAGLVIGLVVFRGPMYLRAESES